MLDWMFQPPEGGDEPGGDIEQAPFSVDPERVPVERTPDNGEYFDALRSVVDPELGINIADLGLVYALEVDGEYVGAALAATTPACPMTSVLVGDAREALASVTGERTVEVYLVWEPAWEPSFMSPTAREKLGGGFAAPEGPPR